MPNTQQTMKERFDEKFVYDGAWAAATPEKVLAFIESEKALERQEILTKIDWYIKNCEEMIKGGSLSQFGSASGGMLAQSVLDAFQTLREFVEGRRNED